MRQNRKVSKSGYYHTVIRGVNKQNIFYEEKDKNYFLHLMKKFGRKYGIRYYSYVLMDNHVHFLFDDPRRNLSKFMQVLCSVYARYFNKKYDRIGHLFQYRFASEVIENNEYLLVCCKYILQNPQRAGICLVSEYKWSSYQLYKKKTSLIYKNKILGFFSSLIDFYRFIEERSDIECLDIELRPSEKYENLINTVKRLLQSNNPILKPELGKETILKKLRILRDNNISINNIVRITGVGRYLVQLA